MGKQFDYFNAFLEKGRHSVKGWGVVEGNAGNV